MAQNLIKSPGQQYAVVVDAPASPQSGDPVRFGAATGVALTSMDAAGETTVDFGPGTWQIPVAAVAASGPVAIEPGDALFFSDTVVPALSRRSAGTFFGLALDAVAAGETAVIRVAHVPAGSAEALGVAAAGWLAVPGGLVIDIDTDTESGPATNRLTGQPAILPDGSYIDHVDVVVKEAFGVELVNFELGRDGESDWLLDNDDHNLTGSAPAVSRIYTSPVVVGDTPLLIDIDQVGNATGLATIIVHYSMA